MDNVEAVMQQVLIGGLPRLSDRGPGFPHRIEKPWGHELLWAFSDHYAAKILHIRMGQRLSLQYHRVKEETLLLVCGRMALDLEGAHGRMGYLEALPGQVFHIPAGRKHRMTALETCDILEVSTPEIEDVVRLQDDFGRLCRSNGSEGCAPLPEQDEAGSD